MNDEVNTTSTQKQGMNPLLIGGIIVALVIVVGAALLLNRNSSTTPAMTETQMEGSGVTGMDTATPVGGEVMSGTPADKTVTVEAGSFYYSPKEIRVKKGDRVKIIMTSKDMMHDFMIDELNVQLPITSAGETKTVEFVAEKAGEFEYYCSVGQHRANGQVGKLIVEE